MTATAPPTTRQYAGIEIPSPGTFDLDPSHTTVGFSARHMMVSKVRGRFDSVTGTLTIAEDPLESSVQVSIDAASVNTGEAKRDEHLTSPDFLDVERFPHITFASTRVLDHSAEGFRLEGELTVRDVTRTVTLDASFEGVATSPWGTEAVGFSARTELDREDFGLTWNQALETGGVLVGKRITVEIEAELMRRA